MIIDRRRCHTADAFKRGSNLFAFLAGFSFVSDVAVVAPAAGRKRRTIALDAIRRRLNQTFNPSDGAVGEAFHNADLQHIAYGGAGDEDGNAVCPSNPLAVMRIAGDSQFE